MRMLIEVARITFIQLARDRIFQLTAVFMVVLLLLNILFSEMSIAEQKRIYVDFGLSLIHLVTMFISIIVAVLTYRRDIASKSLYTILVRPITRELYLIGQYLGVVAVVTCLVVLFTLLLHGIFLIGYSGEFYRLFYLAMLGILAESYLAIAIALFFTTWLSYPIAIGMSFCVLALGHWMSSFRFFLDQAQAIQFKSLGEIIYWTLPHLERVNFRHWPIVPSLASPEEACWGLLQIFCYCIAFISLAALVIRTRDIE